jgi:hypothetical protein
MLRFFRPRFAVAKVTSQTLPHRNIVKRGIDIVSC